MAVPSERPQHTPSSATVFVGREHETAAFASLLERLMGGLGGLVMLVGQPGIGKTRMLLECAEQARQRSARVLSGICREEPGMPPYWPWRQIIRTFADHEKRDLVVECCGDALDEIALVVPELAPDLAVAPRRTADVDASTRFQLFDAISRLFLRIAADQPTVISIDNLHLADAPSLRLLEFIAPELAEVPLLIVGTYRDVELSRDHPMSAALGQLVTQPSFHRIRLRGIELSESTALIENLTGGVAPGELIGTIHRQTEGNPLFMIEVVRYLIDAGYFRASRAGAFPDSVRVPEGVREAVGQRLNRLPEDSNKILAIASVLGRNFGLDELTALSDDFTDAERNAGLEAAITAHIIEEVPGTANRLQFTHALIRETLYDEIPATRRVQLHAAAAKVIERVHDVGADNVLSRLAHHYFHGQLITGSDKVIEYASRAAARAASVMAFEDAAKCLALAVDCADMGGRAAQSDTCEMRLQLGEAQRKAGDTKAAMRTSAEVAKLAERMDDSDLFARAALAFESARYRPGLPGDSAVDLLQRALNKLPSDDSGLRCQLLGSLARALSYTDRRHQAASMAHESIEIARRIDDPIILCAALNHAVIALRRQPDRATTRLSYCREQLEIANRLGSAERAVEAHSTLRSELLETGELAAFQEAFADYESLTRRLRQPHFEYQLAFVEVMRALLAGEFDAVPSLAARALRIGGRLQGADADGVYAMQMFTLHRERGSLAPFAPILRSILDNDEGLSVWAPGLALLYAEIGERDRAAALLDELSVNDFLAVARDELWLTSMIYLAEVCATVGDAANAKLLYEHLLPHRGRNVVFSAAIICYGPVDRLLGLLAGAVGRWSDAERHFATALSDAKRLESGPCQVRIQCDRAEVLLRRGNASAAREAKPLLAEVVGSSAQYGMNGLRARAVRLQDSLKGRSTSNLDELTRRELDVLALIADGKSNRQIADRLTISLPTVATHVRNILAKTGSKNRTGAAAYARDKQLLD